jgi:hypothetical protein
VTGEIEDEGEDEDEVEVEDEDEVEDEVEGLRRRGNASSLVAIPSLSGPITP